MLDVLRAVGDDVAQVQVVGLEALGKLADTAQTRNIVAHDDRRHAEADVRAPAKSVEALQIVEDQPEIAADLDLAVVLIQLVDGYPDARDARVQKLPGFLPRQQCSVRDELHLFPALRCESGHVRERGVDQRLAHAAEENGLGLFQRRVVHHPRENRRIEIAEALPDPAVAKAHLAGKIAAGGCLHIQFSDQIFHLFFSPEAGCPSPYPADPRYRASPPPPRARSATGRRAPSAARHRRAA